MAANVHSDFGKAKALVLAIDDDADALAAVAMTLSAAGYACRTARDAAAAMEIACREPLELIISDINLEHADGTSTCGLEFCEELKRCEQLHDVPVIFLSGASIPDVIRRAHAAGGIYYLRKPFDPEVLVELVEKALWMPHLIRRRLQPG